MKPFEEQFTAWVDDKLEGAELAEFEKQLAARPELVADKEEAQSLRDLLRAHPTAPRLKHADFFNHQLAQQIAVDRPRPVEKESAGFWSLGRLAWAGAFSLAVALALYKMTVPQGAPADSGSKYFAQVVEAWPSQPGISATTVYTPEDNVTVVWLDGLDYIPASIALN